MRASLISTAALTHNEVSPAYVGIGSGSVSILGLRSSAQSITADQFYVTLAASYEGHLGLGYRGLWWLESGGGGTTGYNCIFLGDYGDCQSGLTAVVNM